MDETTLYGPVHSEQSVKDYMKTIDDAVGLGGRIEFGGKRVDRPGYFVEPTIISGLPHDSPIVKEEAFSPIVYVLKAKNLDEAIEWNNEVDQGLSSALFTRDLSAVFQV